MRQGQQNRRGRGRNNNNNSSHGNNNNNNRRGQSPLSRSFESNGPGVKIRGNAAHVAEKYMQLARDAQSSGDSVQAENYLQHAEHYNRIIMSAQQQNVEGGVTGGMNQRPRQGPAEFGVAYDDADGELDETMPQAAQPMGGGQGHGPGPGQGGGYQQHNRNGYGANGPQNGPQNGQRGDRYQRDSGQQRPQRNDDFGRQPQPIMKDQPDYGHPAGPSSQPLAAPQPYGVPPLGMANGMEADTATQGEPQRAPRPPQDASGEPRRDRGERPPRSGEEGFRPQRRRRPQHGGSGPGNNGQGGPQAARGEGRRPDGVDPVKDPARDSSPDARPRAKDEPDGSPPVA